MSVNKSRPASTNKTGSPASTPQGGTPPENGAGPQKCTVIFKEKNWTMMTYENEDGSSGFILTNGQSSFHMDSNGNIIQATGKPLGGCGGKALVVAEDTMQKYKSMSVEIMGNDDDTTEVSGANGNTETQKVAPYSITVYGDVAIEAIGGDVGLKGDNISLNALNTLMLKSEDNVVIQAGGRTNIFTGNLNVEALNFNKKIKGGEYNEGSAEFKVEQNKKGALTEITTPGSYRHIVNGNYELGVSGDIAINTQGSYAMSAKKHYFVTALGNADEKIQGKKKIEVTGRQTVTETKQKETFLVSAGTSEDASLKIETNNDVQLESRAGGLSVKMRILELEGRTIDMKSTGETNIESRTKVNIKAPTGIYLN